MKLNRYFNDLNLDSRRINHMVNSRESLLRIKDYLKLDEQTFNDLLLACTYHDIGYSDVIISDYNDHELKGAEYLKYKGFSDIIWKLIANHGFTDVPLHFKLDSSEFYLLELLIFADLTSTGFSVTHIWGRFFDIFNRYSKLKDNLNVYEKQKKLLKFSNIHKLFKGIYIYYKVLYKYNIPFNWWYIEEDYS